MKKQTHTLALTGALIMLSGCGQLANTLNPFYDSPPASAYLGERTDRGLTEATDKGEGARKALDAMASYRRAQAPEPTYPVVQPAVVRLMWIPDHLNATGDLIPAHYAYVKVLGDRWAVQDAFEAESQLGGKSSTSTMPFVYSSEVGKIK